MNDRFSHSSCNSAGPLFCPSHLQHGIHISVDFIDLFSSEASRNKNTIRLYIYSVQLCRIYKNSPFKTSSLDYAVDLNKHFR